MFKFLVLSFAFGLALAKPSFYEHEVLAPAVRALPLEHEVVAPVAPVVPAYHPTVYSAPAVHHEVFPVQEVYHAPVVRTIPAPTVYKVPELISPAQVHTVTDTISSPGSAITHQYRNDRLNTKTIEHHVPTNIVHSEVLYPQPFVAPAARLLY